MCLVFIAEDILKTILSFSEKIRLEISHELFARHTMHMEHQVLFSLKKRRKFKVSFVVVVVSAYFL